MLLTTVPQALQSIHMHVAPTRAPQEWLASQYSCKNSVMDLLAQLAAMVKKTTHDEAKKHLEEQLALNENMTKPGRFTTHIVPYLLLAAPSPLPSVGMSPVQSDLPCMRIEAACAM